MGDAATVIDWNGTDVPAELANVPPGRYRLVAVEAEGGFELSLEQEEGIRAAMRSLDAGHGVPLAAVDAELRAIIAAARAR